MAGKRVFLDVGAHTGETAREVCDNRYRFDVVYCFEPASACWREIEGIDERVQLCKFGLWNQTCEKELYRPGYLGASIFRDMSNLGDGPVESDTISLLKATEWFQEHISSEDLVVMKLNCEGSECDLLDDLMDSGELRKVYNVMIDFDARFVPSLRAREKVVRNRLRHEGYTNIAFTEDVMKGATHQDRIRHWLETIGIHDDLSADDLRRKYDSVLRQLSSKTGRVLRTKLAIRRNLYEPLPASLKSSIRAVFRKIRR